MIEINDTHFDRDFFAAASELIARSARLNEKTRDRLAVCFAEPQDWLAFFFAARELGASILPIHPSTPYAAARRQAEMAGCNWLFFNRLDGERVSEITPERTGQLLQMSSGTTGDAKCIARDWADIDDEVATYADAFRAPDDMSALIACPTTHSYGLICGLLVALKRGQTPAILDTGNPKYLLRKMRETKNPYLISSPAILNTLARLLPQGETMHATMTSGTLLPEPWFELIRARSRHMFQQYGCSEAGCISVNPDVRAANEIGYVLPRWSVDDAGASADPKAIVVGRGNLKIDTRDLGYRKDDGMLVFLSRLDDLINVGGLNVYPKEIEDVLMSMDGLDDTVVFRQHDAVAGQRVAMIYAGSATVDAQSIRKWCQERLAPHQRPSEIQRVDRVPRLANGKISRREVAARYENGDFSGSEAA